jgi:serine protein kinase
MATKNTAKSGNAKLTQMFRNFTAPAAENELLTFDEYLELAISEPWITRGAFQLNRDMIYASGISHKIIPGKQIEHLFHFFEDNNMVGNNVVFGQRVAKKNLVEKIDNASRGNEAAKRLWILLGPPGSAKSRSMNALKHALKMYSLSHGGKTYTILLPTVDERLKDKAVLTETINGKAIYYLQAPIYEKPLQIIPHTLRADFQDQLNAAVDQENLAKFLEAHPQYDDSFDVNITDDISPFARRLIDDFMNDLNIDFHEFLSYVRVKRMIYDADRKIGIGSYTPRDPKSQEAGSIVGNVDYSLLPRYGSESHPLVHDYQGELCVGANGLVEFHEILKLDSQYLYELIFATADRFFKPEGQPPIPFNGIIIGHTNFHEYNMFQQNDVFEALRSRSTFIEMPLSVNFMDEERIYELTYSNESRNWSKEKKNTAHTAPHSLAFLALTAVMTRLHQSQKHPTLSALQKALVYAGRTDNQIDNNTARTIQEEYKWRRPSEGTFGIDPRLIQDVFEITEHDQRHEHSANRAKLVEEADQTDGSILDSLALENPCVSSVDLYFALEATVKEKFANNKEKLSEYVNNILPEARKWIFSQIASDVYEAILQDDNIVDNTWKKYTDHVQAYANNRKVRHDVTKAEIDPDEEFMKKIENYLGIAEKEVFRKELSDAISSVGHRCLLDDEPSYQNAIKKYVFESEFKSSENMKLLGWVKSGRSSAEANEQEQEDLNSAIKYLIEKKGYCGNCAFQALSVTAEASTISD